MLEISHELRYYVEENSDGDQYTVEIFEATNHAGADVRITDGLTGEVRELQLKATNYESYIQQHSERYGGIPVMATEEMAGTMDGVESSGISREELSDDVDSVIQGLGDVDDPSVLASMSVAGMVTARSQRQGCPQGRRDERSGERGPGKGGGAVGANCRDLAYRHRIEGYSSKLPKGPKSLVLQISERLLTDHQKAKERLSRAVRDDSGI